MLENFEGNIFERDSLRVECIFPVQGASLVYVIENKEIVYDAMIGEELEHPSLYEIRINTYKPGKWEEIIQELRV